MQSNLLYEFVCGKFTMKHTYDGVGGADDDINLNERFDIFVHNSYGYEYQLPKYESI